MSLRKKKKGNDLYNKQIAGWEEGLRKKKKQKGIQERKCKVHIVLEDDLCRPEKVNNFSLLQSKGYIAMSRANPGNNHY